MLATTVALHDIDDVESFVHATLNQSGIPFQPEERDELVCEGFLILYRLADQYQPQLAGYATTGRFSGYAARYLPRKLGDVWHSRNPNHRRITLPDGKREWVYLDPPVSLDGLRARAARNSNGETTHGDHIEARVLPRSHWVPVAAD